MKIWNLITSIAHNKPAHLSSVWSRIVSGDIGRKYLSCENFGKAPFTNTTGQKVNTLETKNKFKVNATSLVCEWKDGVNRPLNFVLARVSLDNSRYNFQLSSYGNSDPPSSQGNW